MPIRPDESSTETAFAGVVTVSASYGARGGTLGPAVARELAVPFIDRAIPVTVAQRMNVPLETVEAADGRAESPLWRMFARMATIPDLTAGADALAYVRVADDTALCRQTEQVLRDISAAGGAVVLGRAAAVVLADVPGALHVRLDGPRELRVRAAAERRKVSEREADDEAKNSDSARAAYVRHFYKVEGTSPELYHLMIDTTALDADTVVDLIARAARSRQ